MALTILSPNVSFRIVLQINVFDDANVPSANTAFYAIGVGRGVDKEELVNIVWTKSRPRHSEQNRHRSRYHPAFMTDLFENKNANSSDWIRNVDEYLIAADRYFPLRTLDFH